MKASVNVMLIIDFSEEYGRALLKGIARYSQLHGPWTFCRIPIYQRKPGEMKELIDWAREWGAQGIIAQIQSETEADILHDSGIPVIAQDFSERFSQIPNITGQYAKTGQMAADHFLQLGFTRFAFYGPQNMVWSRERGEGFAERVAERGYETLFYNQPKPKKVQMWNFVGTNLPEWLLSLPKPIAVMACDDNHGQHLLEACRQCEISVPEDVAILGVDNDEVICNLLEPPLSSISLTTENAGYEAAKLLEQMMAGQTNDQHDIIVEPVQVIVRRSSDLIAIQDPEVGKAMKFIHAQYKELIQVDDVVQATNLSRRVLEKRFADQLGKTILEELTHLRIEHVSNMLIQTRLSIAEIATACGYADERNLSRYFKMRKGMTPLAYRKKFTAF